MTRDAFLDLFRDLYKGTALDPERTAGIDMVPASDLGEAAGFRCTVLCPENRLVPAEFECPHTCLPGSCEGCPGAEEPA